MAEVLQSELLNDVQEVYKLMFETVDMEESTGIRLETSLTMIDLKMPANVRNFSDAEFIRYPCVWIKTIKM